MSAVEPRILKGFRDYLPAEMLPRQEMIEKIERVFQSFGFLPLVTPALEYADILLGKYGEEGDSLLYRFLDNGERDVALRYDLTVPLARVVAQYPELPRPFRRYQIAPVWRAEKPARGRFREFVQCDGDIVGSGDPMADAEIIQLGAAMLEALGVENFTIRANNRKILAGLMEELRVPAGEPEMAVLRTIDKLPKIGPDETRKLLALENRLEEGQINRTFEFLGIQGSPLEILGRLQGFFASPSSPGSGAGAAGVSELRGVFQILEGVGLLPKVAMDLSIARGLNYYTGTIYETFLGDLPGIGSVMSGGRYDGLIGMFAGEQIPAVGISLGVDRLLAGLQELKLVAAGGSPAAVLITVFDAALAAVSARIAQTLRRAGIACELFPQAARLAKQFRYAERTRKRFAVVVGPEEAARGVVQLKDLNSRAQEEIPADQLVERLKIQ
ncbi:MAG: histidine--tRNA ligase [Planctomycetes bacterium]|nr:histidine--tRNA ligase [Planctomycetota bacterium]